MSNTVKYVSSGILLLYIVSLIALCIIQTESLPQVEAEWFGIPTDKIVHFVMFLPFPVLTWLAFFKEERIKWKKVGLCAIILICGMVLAAGTEVAQTFTEYRDGDILDFAADCLGMAAGLALVILVSYLSRKRRVR
ncbi:MAG: VanZ family protein [Candidatus Cryptobacteroides sp.]